MQRQKEKLNKSMQPLMYTSMAHQFLLLTRHLSLKTYWRKTIMSENDIATPNHISLVSNINGPGDLKLVKKQIHKLAVQGGFSYYKNNSLEPNPADVQI